MKTLLTFPIILILLLAGCSHNNSVQTPGPVVPVETRVAQYNQVVALSNESMAQVLINLTDAGVVSTEDARTLAVFQAGVAKTTKGVAVILAQPGTWLDKSIQIQNLALSLVPPAGYRKFGAADNVQYQAMVLAIDSIESTLQIMVQIARESPATK